MLSQNRRGFTGRAVVLGAVLVLLAVLLAAPMHRFVSARAAVGQATRQQEQSQAQLAQLQKQASQLNDPAYIEKLARSRLLYAMPGDTVYTVIDSGQASAIDQTAVPVVNPKPVGSTWNQRLWGSVQAADGSTP